MARAKKKRKQTASPADLSSEGGPEIPTGDTEEQTAVDTEVGQASAGAEAVAGNLPHESDHSDVEVQSSAGAEVVSEVAPEEISKVEATVEAVREMAEAFIETRKERDEMKSNWVQTTADYDNYRKRVYRDRHKDIEQASERVMQELVRILDALDSALRAEISPTAVQNMRQGLEGVRHLLLEVMERESLIPVEAVPGTPFDPAVHEAQAVEDAGEVAEDASTVVRVELRRGYRYRSGKVLRPAEVEVGFDSPAAPEGEGDTEPSAEDEEAAQPDTADVEDGPVAVDDSVSGEAVDGVGMEEGETPVDKD